MNKDQFSKAPSKTLGSHKIVLETEYVSDDYIAPQILAEVRTTETGHLELARIEPKKPSLPSFSVRWDHADEAVDVDLITGTPEESSLFKQQKQGYRGHKTERVSQSPRIYGIDISTPRMGKIFSGRLTMNLEIGVNVTSSLSFSDHCTAEVVPAGKKSRTE